MLRVQPNHVKDLIQNDTVDTPVTRLVYAELPRLNILQLLG